MNYSVEDYLRYLEMDLKISDPSAEDLSFRDRIFESHTTAITGENWEMADEIKHRAHILLKQKYPSLLENEFPSVYNGWYLNSQSTPAKYTYEGTGYAGMGEIS